MDLKDIGLILKKEREKRGYSREDVYRETKISIMNIEALERGDFESLPHPVYTRAFIKSYAEFLGLEPKEFLETFDSYHATNQPRHKKFDSLKEIDGIKLKKWIGIFILFFILFIVTSVFYFKNHSKDNLQEKNGKIDNNILNNSYNKTEENNFLLDNPSSINSTKNFQNNTENMGNQSNNTKYTEIFTEEGNKTDNSTKITKLEQNKTGEINVKEINKNENKESVKEEYHLVEISARDTCWVKGWMDENSTKERLLSKGDRTIFKFKDNLKIKVGNAGVIDLYFDGKKIDINGKVGEVKTLNFPFHD